MVPANRQDDNLSHLIAYIQEGIVLLERDGKVRYASPSTQNMIGQPVDKLIGRNILHYVHPEDQAAALQRIDELLQRPGDNDTIICRTRVRDGSYRWLEGTAVNLINEPGVAAILVTFRDITERRSIEEALHSSDQQLRAVLNSAPIVLFAMDMEGVYTLSVGRELEVLGLEPGQMVGRNAFEEYRDYPELCQQMREALAGERTQWIGQVAGRYFDTRGTLEYDADGNPTGLIGVATNITERMRTYASLRESERRFRGTFNQAAVGIAHIDTDGRWVRINQKLCEITGYSERELLTRKFQDLSHPDDLLSVNENMRDMLAGKMQTIRRERRSRNKSGKYIWVHLTFSLVRDSRGRPRFFIMVMEDISQRMKIQQDRDDLLRREQAARATAESANQAKDQFMAIVSHELRTPLTPILAGVGLLKRNKNIPADAQMILDMIRRNADLEARLIDDLLDLTRITNGQLTLSVESVDVHDLIHAAIDIHAPDLQTKQIKLDLNLDASSHNLRADPGRLQQVFWKIIGNAIKFTDSGGTIRIATGNQGNDIVIMLTDTGIGIEPSEMSRLFNAFEQAERSLSRRYGGLGVGLTICRALIELHGGTLNAFSEGRGTGTRFEVRLPLQSAVGAATRLDTTHQLQPLHILLVEDNIDSQQLLRRLLASEGHHVTSAGSLAEARTLAGENTFDLLLCDIGLPDGSGWQLMQEFRDTYGLRGIALSGFSTDEDIRRSLEAGFSAHVVKPINFQQLHDAILHALNTGANPATPR